MNQSSHGDRDHALKMSQRLAGAVLIVSLALTIHQFLRRIDDGGDLIIVLTNAIFLANTAWLGRRAFTKMRFMTDLHREEWDPRIQRRLVMLHLTDVAVLMVSAMGLVRSAVLLVETYGKSFL